jgi:hypothetical protein
VVVPAVYGNLGCMEKTTVYLTAEQKTALAQAAEAEGRSEARLIRAGIDSVIAGHRAAEARAELAQDVPGTQHAAPTAVRPRWIGRDAFVRLVQRHPADPALQQELRDLAPGTTDDEPLP